MSVDDWLKCGHDYVAAIKSAILALFFVSGFGFSGYLLLGCSERQRSLNLEIALYICGIAAAVVGVPISLLLAYRVFHCDWGLFFLFAGQSSFPARVMLLNGLGIGV